MTCAADNYRDRHEHFTSRSAAEREVLFYEASVGALENAATSGPLVVCDLVYAELCTYFSSQRECDAFLEGNEIRVEPSADNYRDRHEHFTGRSAAEREV